MATQSAEGVVTRTLTLPEELVLMLLNEENGYFHQVPGWALNCAIVGASLAELSLQSRIDTDMDSLFLVHRSGRMYLRAKDYFADFEKVYGASGVLPSLDGADHFRLRKSMSAAYSRGRLESQLDQLYHHVRTYRADWKVGEVHAATPLSRRMINAQISPMSVSVDSQDIFDDLAKYKERALLTHIVRALPKFMLSTPGMRRRAKAVDVLLARVQSVHTPAQRAGAPRDIADDLLSLHASDPQFVPESNLRFALSAALIASVYLGDAFSASRCTPWRRSLSSTARFRVKPMLCLENGDPDAEDFTLSAMDVTHRFLMECLRMYPIVPMSIRNVMNSCVVEGYELPAGSRIFIAQTAGHYMPEVFPDPTPLISTAIHPRETSITVPATRRTGWARTPVSASGGWSCSWQ